MTKKAVHEEPAQEEPLDIELPKAAPEVAPKKSPKQLWQWALSHKKKSIPAAIVVLLLLLTAIPQTRYLLPGLVIKKNVSFIVQDKSGLNRISDANVLIDGQLFTSDQNGVVNAQGIRPGTKTVRVDKLFYKQFSKKVTISALSNKQQTLPIESTGRPAKVTVKNRLNGLALAGVSIKTENGSQAKTGEDGTALLILPSDKSEVKATMSGDKIVTADINVRAVQDDSTNVYPATPVGRIFFLSKASGKIDLIKTNLDGTDRQVVLAGTGRENDGGTNMMASADWKYIALEARRDSELSKLYLIETETGKLSVLDEGNASFNSSGWIGHYFVYLVNRNGYNPWDAKRQALKSFNADTKKIAILDESRASGASYDYGTESIDSPLLKDDQIIYGKSWSASYYYGNHLADKRMAITAVKPDNTGKKVLKDWPDGYDTYMYYTDGGATKIRYSVTLEGRVQSKWEYENGAVKEVKGVSDDEFQKGLPWYIKSPNGKNQFWGESRDGKTTLFIGDVKGANGKEIGTLSEFQPYGWFTDDYVLVSKSGTELYIMGRDGIKPGDVPTKISDIHGYRFRGY